MQVPRSVGTVLYSTVQYYSRKLGYRTAILYNKTLIILVLYSEEEEGEFILK